MRSRAPNDPAVEGKLLRNDFYVHVIPSSTEPMLHISRRKRREIVIFNDNQTFGNRFLYLKPGLTARSVDGNKVEIKVYRSDEGDKVITCSRRVSDVIEQLGNLGCDYGSMIDLIQDAQKNGEINTEVVIDAIPKIGGKKKPTTQTVPSEINPQLPGPDEAPLAGPIPELFRTETGAGYADYDESPRTDLEQTDPIESEEPEAKTGFFDKLRKRFKRR